MQFASVQQVGAWLQSLAIPEDTIALFTTAEIDGKTLLALKPDEIKDEIGVKQIGIRKKIVEALDQLRVKPKFSDEWTVDDVASWLANLHFPSQVVNLFKDGAVDGKTLLGLSAQEIKDDVGVS